MPRTRTFRPLRLLIAVAGSVVVGTAPLIAAEFEDLYTVVVAPDPAAAGAAAERAAAERAAMAVLLTRITGRRDAAEAPELRQLIDGAGSYVNSYGRLSRDELQVGFSRGAVEAELTAADWPLWGAERPLTLVWLAVDMGNGERGVLSASAAGEAATPALAAMLAELDAELRTAADRRGLPIALPLWDLVDINVLSFAELWGGFDLQIAEASRRYAADAVLVGRLQMTRFGARAQWTLLRERERRVFVADGVADGIDWLADQFAGEFASIGGARYTRITVSGVRDFNDYGRVMRFLDGASVLENVDVEAFDDERLTLRVAARGDAATIARVLTLGEVLARVPRSFGQPADDGALDFEVAR